MVLGVTNARLAKLRILIQAALRILVSRDGPESASSRVFAIVYFREPRS